MGETPFTYGLVEMLVDLPENAHDGDAFEDLDAVHDRLRQRCGQAKKDRIADVLRILSHPDLQTVDLLMFPGYTLPIGDEPIPADVLAAIGARTVVLETFGPNDTKHEGKVSGARRMHVLQGGGPVLVTPIVQQIITAHDAEDGDRVEQVVKELRTLRLWTTRGVRCALVICGEVNVVKHSETGDRPLHEDLEACLTSIDLVVNPAHTRTRLPAMHCKRDWFARGRVLVTTANLHGSVRVWQYRKATSRWRITRASSGKAAQLFIGSPTPRRFNRDQLVDGLGARVVTIDGGHQVTVVEHRKTQEVLYGA